MQTQMSSEFFSNGGAKIQPTSDVIDVPLRVVAYPFRNDDEADPGEGDEGEEGAAHEEDAEEGASKMLMKNYTT